MLLKTAALYVVIMLICAVALAGDYMAGIRVPDDVRVVLEKAGDNRVELERVIARYHYAGADDSLKLAAAYFLIGNMEGHSYVTFELRDSAGAEIEFANTDYVNYDSLLAAWEVMEKEHPGLDFEKKDAIEDIASIKAEFLIDNIDRAFAAWQSRPWARGFSFEDFREYILPYRGSNEPLENWRAHFMEKYSGIESTMTDPSDAVEAARIINKDVMTYFTFDPRYYYHPTDQGLGEMLSGHLGRCEDMTNITIYAMRANGLAVTSDYTPYWANSGNNHAWNAIVTPNSRAIPFMGAEANPGEYSLANKLAKVYRKMYSKQADNLTFQTRKQVGVPGWLAGKSYIDVTQDYIPTRDITVTLEKPAPDTVDVAYICVFNDGEWKPIHWGRVKNGEVTFSAMGTDIVYLPAYFVNDDSLDPAGPPFIPLEGGAELSLSQATDVRIYADLLSSTARVQEYSTDGVAKAFLDSAKTYELFYWDYGWRSLGKMAASGGPLRFQQVPYGYLYWLVAEGSNRDERIFTIEDGQQVWW
jgi:hypothetical protein